MILLCREKNAALELLLLAVLAHLLGAFAPLRLDLVASDGQTCCRSHIA
jgi:hypothetical protein